MALCLHVVLACMSGVCLGLRSTICMCTIQIFFTDNIIYYLNFKFFVIYVMFAFHSNSSLHFFHFFTTSQKDPGHGGRHQGTKLDIIAHYKFVFSFENSHTGEWCE